jgi:group I intron endonuclease
MIIYLTTNLINGMIYVGQDSYNNWNYYGSGVKILKAIKKYGKESFKKEVIGFCSCLENMNEQEIFWIAKLDSTNPKIGYNLATGGSGCCGIKFSKETIKKMSKSHKGKKIPKEIVEKTKNTKKKWSQEKRNQWCEKISKANKGKKRTKKMRKKLSLACMGRVVSEKTKEKIKKTLFKNIEKFKKKMSEVTKGKNNPRYIKLSRKNMNKIKKMYKNNITKAEISRIMEISYSLVYQKLKEMNLVK